MNARIPSCLIAQKIVRPCVNTEDSIACDCDLGYIKQDKLCIGRNHDR